MTLRRNRKDGEKEIDPKMEELKRQLNTEDGGNIIIQPTKIMICFNYKMTLQNKLTKCSSIVPTKSSSKLLDNNHFKHILGF